MNPETAYTIADGYSLFDDLVRNGENARRDGELERLGGIQVDHELELGGPQDGQIRRLCAFEDAAGVDADHAIAVREICAVGHQPAGHGPFADIVYDRKSMTRRQRNDE